MFNDILKIQIFKQSWDYIYLCNRISFAIYMVHLAYISGKKYSHMLFLYNLYWYDSQIYILVMAIVLNNSPSTSLYWLSRNRVFKVHKLRNAYYFKYYRYLTFFVSIRLKSCLYVLQQVYEIILYQQVSSCHIIRSPAHRKSPNSSLLKLIAYRYSPHSN